MTISEKQAAVVTDLNSQIDWAAKITRIIAYGADLPTYPTDTAYNAERFVVRAADCSTRTFFLVGRSGQNQYVRAKSNATIPLGLAGIIHYIYDGQPLNDVASFTPTFITSCGLDTHLTVGQLNLLNAMIQQLSDFINDIPMTDTPTPQSETNRLAIVALQTRATTDEASITANTTAITTETTNRTTADATLQTNITAEATARANADTTLQTNITAEATSRANADTTLQSNITAEATARSTADATLQTNIDNEASSRQSADTTLQSSITAEATARANADTTLQTNITAEATARQTADTRIENKVNFLTPATSGVAGQVLTIGEDGNSTIWKTPDIGGIEVVTIQLSTEDGLGTVSGVQVAVQVEGENTTRTYTSDSSGKVKLNVSFGLQYVVSFGGISGYVTPNNLTYRASLLTRTISGVYRIDATSSKEHVVVTLSYTSSGSTASSLRVQTDAGTTTYSVVSNQCEFYVALGSNYTILFDAVSGFNTPASQTYTATFSIRSVSAAYIGAMNDLCWVKASDGTTIPFEDISMDNVAGIVGLRISSSVLAQQSASFVIPMEYLIDGNIVSEGTTIVTRKSLGSKAWLSSQVLLTSLPCYTSASAATTPDSNLNLSGENNTTVYLAEAADRGLTAAAFTACRGVSYTINGVTKYGFLGSYAQIKTFADNFDSIKVLLNSVFGHGCILIKSGSWWTSTQSSATNAVHLNNGSFGYNCKTLSNQVVPFLAY